MADKHPKPKPGRSKSKDPKFKDDMATLNQLVREKAEMELMMDWYQNSCPSARGHSLNRIFSYSLDKSDLEAARVLKGDLSENVNAGTVINLIRFHLLDGHPEEAVTAYETACPGFRRKRTASLIYTHLFKNGAIDKACEFYREHCAGTYPVDPDDITLYMEYGAPKPELAELLQHTLGQPICIPLSHVIIEPELDGTVLDGRVKLLEFAPEQRDFLIEGLKRRLTRKGKTPDPESGKYDYIVDGANVMFFYDRKITAQSYHRVTSMLKALRRRTLGAQVLLVLHERHFRPKGNKWDRQAHRAIAEWKDLPGVTFCVTPKGVCDDYYQLLNAFHQEDALLVSNDQFRDHINSLSKIEGGVDLVRQWRKEKVIEYQFERGLGHPILSLPAKYSHRVQQPKDGVYYVPCNDGDKACFVRIDTN